MMAQRVSSPLVVYGLLALALVGLVLLGVLTLHGLHLGGPLHLPSHPGPIAGRRDGLVSG